MKHIHYDVLLAIAEGKEVECKLCGEWVCTRFSEHTPLEDAHLEWRVKPDMDDVIFEAWKCFQLPSSNEDRDIFKGGFLAGVQACQNGEYY